MINGRQNFLYVASEANDRDRRLIAMDELTQARVKLSLLEKQERELVKTLCDVRLAAEAQRTKIKELVKRLPSPIDRLPNELFLLIIGLAIHATRIETELLYTSNPDADDWKTKALMMVSHHWRNIIWHSPKLWSTIVVAPSWQKSRLKAYVERSWPSPIDIEIYSWPSWEQDSQLDEMLDVAILCADRWRNVSVYAADNVHLALRRIRHLTLPSLARLSMEHIPAFLDGNSDIFDPQFFTPGNSPFLEYLEIGGDFITSFGLPMLPSLKELHIYLPPPTSNTSPTFLERLSMYPRLVTLTVSGDARTLELLRPNSILLPILDELICTLPNASSLLHTIVAPRLSYFNYHPWTHSDGTIFAGLGSKFSSVRHLALRGTHLGSNLEDIFSAFPNVRHVELHRNNADVIFKGTFSSATWQHLEHLSIYGGKPIVGFDRIDHDIPDFLEGLVNWLQLRQNSGQSDLRIQLSFFVGDANWISKMYDALNGLCVLEWVAIAFSAPVGLSGTSIAPWLVNQFLHILLISGLTSCRTWYLYLLASQPVSATRFWRVISREVTSDP